MKPTLQLRTSLQLFRYYSSLLTPIALPNDSITNDVIDKIDSRPRISTLPNGLRVASMDCYGPLCSIGMFINAGSRYSVFYPRGLSHFLGKMLFLSTSFYPDRQSIQQELESISGMFDFLIDRELLLFKLSGIKIGIDSMAHVLSESLYRPKLSSEEIELSRAMLSTELIDYEMKPDLEPKLTDITHSAAYSDNTLGLTSICPEESINKIQHEHLTSYLSAHCTPERMALVGLGVEHEKLVALAVKHFTCQDVTWGQPMHPIDESISQYTGDEIRIERKEAPIVGPNRLPNLGYVTLSSEACSYHDRLFIPFCVLNILMGGGSSFSAGGPGKGMYSRLYTEVLCRHRFMKSAQSFAHIHSDGGIFSLYGSAEHKDMTKLINVFARQLSSINRMPTDEEFNRAKKMLLSNMLMNLEMHPIIFEDLGRQILGHNQFYDDNQLSRMIVKVSKEDICEAGNHLLKGKFSMVAVGQLEHIPNLNYFEELMSRLI